MSQIKTRHQRGTTVAAGAASIALVVAGCGSSSHSAQSGSTGSKAGLSGSASSSKSPIDVGVVAALTGDASGIGTEAVDGAKIAVKDINDKGGVGGRLLHLQYEDDASNASQGIALLKQFASNSSISFVMSMDSSADAVPLAGAANQEKIFLGTAGSTSSKVRGAGPWAMTMSGTESDMMNPLIKYASAQHDKTVAMVTDSDNEGFVNQSNLFADGIKSGGGRVLTNVNTVSSNEDVAPDVAKIASLKPQGVLLDILSNQAASFIDQYSSGGAPKADFYGPISLFSPAFIKAGGSAVDGAIVASDYGYDTSPAAKQFATEFQSAYGRPASDFAAIGYAAVQYVASRLSKSSGGLTRSKVEQLMTAAGSQPSILGATGTTTTNSQGQINYSAALLQVKGGQFVTAPNS